MQSVIQFEVTKCLSRCKQKNENFRDFTAFWHNFGSVSFSVGGP